MTNTPYRGLRVVDLTDVWAGPMAASFLGDLGADVVRVESFPRPGILRPIQSTAAMHGFLDDEPLVQPTWERSIRYFTANRNKRGIALNLKEADGQEIMRRLLSSADIFLESFASGVVARLGFGWETVKEWNPNLIMISMSAWGHGGDYHGFRSMGSGIDSSSGHAHLRGYRDTDVSQVVQAYQSDAAAAAAVLFAAGVALRQRRRTGNGLWVDLAQAEVLMANMPTPFLAAAYGLETPEPLEDTHPIHAPYNCYPCKDDDSWIEICVRSQEEWAAFADVIAPEFATDDRFTTPAQRTADRETLDALIGERTRKWSADELMRALQAAGVPAGAVQTNEQLAADDHLHARGFYEEREHPFAGRRTYPGQAWRFNGTPQPATLGSNTVGEHNAEVLRELGFDAAALADLHRRGVIGSGYGPTTEETS